LGNVEVESVRWFLGTVLMVLMTVRDIEENLGLPLEQDKTDQKMKQIKYHERESKAI
jgi:hypothetical protein